MNLLALSIGRTLISVLFGGLSLTASPGLPAQDSEPESSARPKLRDPLFGEIPATVEECVKASSVGNGAIVLARHDVQRAIHLQREATLEATQDAVEAHAILRHSAEQLAAAEERIQRIRQQHEAGVTSIRAVLEAENARTAARRDQAIAQANALFLIGSGTGEEGEPEVPAELESMLELLIQHNPSIRQARLAVQMSQEKLSAARLEVAREVRRQFHEVQVLRGAEEVLRQHLITVTAMVEQAVTSTAELLEARAQLLQAGSDRTRAEAELRYLLGMGVWDPKAP